MHFLSPFCGLFLKSKSYEEIDLNDISDDTLVEEPSYIYVHIDGAIVNPGIKKVEVGTRLFELINLSGGETKEADISRLNLASVLKDEQKIVVPYKIVEDKENLTSSNNVAISQANSKEENSNLLININYANSEELQKLNGIGVSMANKIISYRDENGYFNSIEEIKNVSGIGEAKFNKIRENITI